MPAQILHGEPIARRLLDGLAEEARGLIAAGRTPRLAALYVGENRASRLYMRKQREACAALGIGYETAGLPIDTTEERVLEEIRRLNDDPRVTGIIVQMPVPPHIDSRRLRLHLDPAKDVEGMHPESMGRLVYGTSRLSPCTAAAAVELARSVRPSFARLDVTIVGHSETVGKAIALLVLQSPFESATPTVCHIATRDLAAHTRSADVLFVAVGKAGLVRGDMIKPGATVIDIGINHVDVLDDEGMPVIEDGRPKRRIVGDVVFEEAANVCAHITPVPGGVGPLTVVMLIRNTIECAKGIDRRKGAVS